MDKINKHDLDARGLAIAIAEQLLNMRAIERHIILPLFQQARNIASVDEKKIVLRYIDSLDKEKVVLWTKRIINDYTCYEEYSTGKLRELAKELKIKNYTYLTKAQLLSEIRKLEE